MSNIVSSPGVYRNFSGHINQHGLICTVTNATFEILDEPKRYKGRYYMWLIFNSGTVTSGDMHFAVVENCNFQGNRLKRSVFCGGVFSGKKFEYSFWCGGEWKGKEWHDGFDKFGRTRSVPPTMWGDLIPQTSGVASCPGRYENFSGAIKWRGSNMRVQDAFFELSVPVFASSNDVFFHSGTILGGVANGIVVNYCIWEEGHWEPSGIWWDGVWERGTWKGGKWWGGTFKGGDWWKGDWFGGIWESGVWRNGEWSDGTWENGTWKKGFWRGGYDKSGEWHKKGDSPDKWDL